MCFRWKTKLRILLRFRERSKLKRLLLLAWLVTFGLMLIHLHPRTLQSTLRNRYYDILYFRNIFIYEYRPELWADVSNSKLLKVFWATRNEGGSALAACTQPARATSDIISHRNPLGKLLASETEARPEDTVAYTSAWTWINQTPERRKQYFRFGPKLTPEQKTQLLLTWRVVHEALKLSNISHYLVGGSLMGALRHRGIIPWDDDIDVAVDESDVDKIMRALSCIPGYTLHLQPNLQWKFFPNNTHIMSVYSEATVLQPKQLTEEEKKDYTIEWHPRKTVVRRSPLVDLFLMNRDDSYTWSYGKRVISRYFFHLEDVYPLTSIFFDGYLVPVPRRSHSIVNKIYEANICVSEVLDHLDGTSTLAFKDRASIDCGKLAPIYTIYPVA